MTKLGLVRIGVIGAALLAATGAVFSQSLPLSSLTAGTAVGATDLFYDVQTVGVGGVKVTGTQVKTFMSATPTFSGTVTFPDNSTWASGGIVLSGLSAVKQCLQAATAGLVSGTGNACGAGGANTQVQFNNNGASAGDSGFTVVTPGQVTLAFSTVTVSTKALNITGSWNNGATTFAAPLFVNIATAANATNSALVEFQASGKSVFKAVAPGTTGFSQVLVPIGSAIASQGPGLAFVGSLVSFASSGLGASDSGSGDTNLAIWQNGIIAVNFSQGSANKQIRFPSDWTFGWASAPNNNAAMDTGASRDSAGVIDFGNGTASDKSATIQAKQGTFLTITAATATLFMGSNSVTAMSLSPTIVFYGQSNPGANETYAVCAGSGATSLTSGGQVFVDTTTCLASSMLVKHDIAAFNDYGMMRLASLAAPLNAGRRLAPAPIDIDPIAEAMALVPVVATYDTIDNNPQFTLIAQNACKVDERLCERTRDGSVRSFRPNAVISILVAALQKQQREIEELRLKIEGRR